MNISSRIVVMLSVCLAACIRANAADSAAGRNTFTANCSGCHPRQSFAGRSSAELETELKDIVAGGKGHPMKLTLSPSAIADLAAFMSSKELNP